LNSLLEKTAAGEASGQLEKRRSIHSTSARSAIASDRQQSKPRSLNGYLSKLVNYRQSLNFRDGRCQKGLLKEGLLASQRVDKDTPLGGLVKEEGST
jgi:hypothetical protein